jgi:hypothetical protein
MDKLTIFGLFSVTAGLIFYAFEYRSPGLFWRLLYLVFFAQFMVFFRVRGPLDSLKEFGQLLRYSDGGLK